MKLARSLVRRTMLGLSSAAIVLGCCGTRIVTVASGTPREQPLALCPGARVRVQLTDDDFAHGAVVAASGAVRLQVPGRFSDAFAKVKGRAQTFPVEIESVRRGPEASACELTEGQKLRVVLVGSSVHGT